MYYDPSGHKKKPASSCGGGSNSDSDKTLAGQVSNEGGSSG